MARRPLSRPLQLAAAVVLWAVVVAATPTGLFLRSHVPSQVRSLVELARTEGGMDGRRVRVLGRDYRFMTLVRSYTPDDAVILMSDQHAPSSLERLKGKHQGWATYFLYPRTLLYLHQDEHPAYREASYLILDGEASVYWIDPVRRPEVDPARPGCVPFDMGAYLAAIERGDIEARYHPPRGPLRGAAP